MKVLHVIRELSLGGAARALMRCAEDCADLTGGSHSIISLVRTRDENLIGFCQEKRIAFHNAPDQDTVYRLIAEHDLLHIHYWNSPELNEFLRFKHPPARVLIKFNVGGEYPPHVITSELLEFADFIQTTGPFAHDLPVFDLFGDTWRAGRVTMIYGSADFERLKGIKLKEHTDFNVTYLGTVNFVKMHPAYIEMHDGIQIPDVKFLVCGSGNAYPVLRAQAEKCGSENRFKFIGQDNDIKNILEITDVFGYPLCEDNYASGELVLQEVAYAGIPAVVFNNAGAARLVINDYTGYVVKSCYEYKQAIEYLYKNPEERKRLGKNAKEYANQVFGDKNGARKTAKLYNRILRIQKRERKFKDPLCVIQKAGVMGRPDTIEEFYGASKFLQSLGHRKGDFLISMFSTNDEEIEAAEKRIAKSSPVLARGNGGITNYRNYYNEDGFLCYWSGLTLYHRKQYAKSAVDFYLAAKYLRNNWRVLWWLAKAAQKIGETEIALEAIDKLLFQKHDVVKANYMKERLLKTPSSTTKDGVLTEIIERIEHFLKQKKLNEAEDAGRKFLLKPHANSMELQAYYDAALAIHKNGDFSKAEAMYQELMDHSLIGDELLSWVYFKYGEICLDRGEKEKSHTLFIQAIELKSDHYKAKIYSVRESVPLIVCVGKSLSIKDAVVVDVALERKKMWDYYFDRRKIDKLIICIDSTPPQDALERIAERNVARNGEIIITGRDKFLKSIDFEGKIIGLKLIAHDASSKDEAVFNEMV